MRRLLIRLSFFTFAVLAALVADFARDGGGFAATFNGILDGSMSLPAARIGGPFVIALFLAVVFLLVLSVIYAFSLVGLAALFKGLVLGVVLNVVLDLRYCRATPGESRLTTIRRFAARGATLAVFFALWVGILNPFLSRFGPHPAPYQPLSEILGIMAFTGLFLGFFGAVFGLGLSLARRRSQNHADNAPAP